MLVSATLGFTLAFLVTTIPTANTRAWPLPWLGPSTLHLRNDCLSLPHWLVPSCGYSWLRQHESLEKLNIQVGDCGSQLLHKSVPVLTFLSPLACSPLSHFLSVLFSLCLLLSFSVTCVLCHLILYGSLSPCSSLSFPPFFALPSHLLSSFLRLHLLFLCPSLLLSSLTSHFLSDFLSARFSFT